MLGIDLGFIRVVRAEDASDDLCGTLTVIRFVPCSTGAGNAQIDWEGVMP